MREIDVHSSPLDCELAPPTISSIYETTHTYAFGEMHKTGYIGKDKYNQMLTTACQPLTIYTLPYSSMIIIFIAAVARLIFTSVLCICTMAESITDLLGLGSKLLVWFGVATFGLVG